MEPGSCPLVQCDLFCCCHLVPCCRSLAQSDVPLLACRAESIRTGFMLAQGGEFAFVLLSLAEELKVLPEDLNKLLIIVVVLSMALTPLLADVGKRLAERASDSSDSECC